MIWYRIVHPSINHLLFTWRAVRPEIMTSGTAGASFGGVITLRTNSHCGAPWSSVSVFTACHTHTTTRSLFDGPKT